jgi:HEAT repeat protein
MARRFCEIATARSLPLVLKLARDAELRDATIDALARLADAPQLASMARQSDSSQHRRKLIATLFKRELAQALPLYLELVSDPQTRVDALAAAEGLEDPPWMRCLQHCRDRARICASLRRGRSAASTARS